MLTIIIFRSWLDHESWARNTIRKTFLNSLFIFCFSNITSLGITATIKKNIHIIFSIYFFLSALGHKQNNFYTYSKKIYFWLHIIYFIRDFSLHNRWFIIYSAVFQKMTLLWEYCFIRILLSSASFHPLLHILVFFIGDSFPHKVNYLAITSTWEKDCRDA